jgi:hypothetical protein
MPTGLTNSPGLDDTTQKLLGLAQSLPRAAINISVQRVFANASPIRLPALIVPPGGSVTIRGNNGTTQGNTKSVFVALRSEDLQGAQGYTITPDTEISYPVDNLSQIYASGTAGDGIIVSVRGAAIR